MIVRGDLDGQFYAITNVLNERVSSPIVTFSDLMRENKFCVRVDTTPQPIIAALCLIVLIQAMLSFCTFRNDRPNRA